MSAVGDIERRTQTRVATLFRDRLGYKHLGDWSDRNNRNVEEAYLRAFLQKQKVRPALIERALHRINEVVKDQTTSLYEMNRAFYGLLRYGVNVKANVGENNETVWLIDWKNPLNNDFAIAEEVSIKGSSFNKRPDIVLYVNGIAVGVLELKRSKVSVSSGIRQNIGNQQEAFIRPFFATTQFLMAGNDTEGLRYATIQTPEKYYLTWKEASDEENLLDRALLQLCNKTRLLELMHDFIVFDAGVKKLARHNQYFGVKAAQERVRRREGGILWHSQGSGKSLTMVWLAKWIRENIENARVLIITDRTELDQQIEQVFRDTEENITRTQSGAELITLLNRADVSLICSLVHKFGNPNRRRAGDNDIEAFIEEVRSNLPPGFRPKGTIFVYVDECHRTQSGKLHSAMKELLPNATFIGFTGTPLLSQEKKRTLEVFGSYIHTYKFNEAVADGVVLDLKYEARQIDQNIKSQKELDTRFETQTRGLTDVAKAKLKQRWATMQSVLSSRGRLDQIVDDIINDMQTKPRLLTGEGNAILVSDSIYNACRFYEMFQRAGLTQCAIVTSYQPSASDIALEYSGGGDTEKLEQFKIYTDMLAGKTTEAFEKEVKRQFIETPGQMKLLIVVDKLLTGFDAPSATYLYIDKPMRDHGLFQAICRVNRLDGDSKEYGYIIDYRDLFKSLAQSIQDYTAEAFEGYDAADVKGLLENRLTASKVQFEESLEQIRILCEPVGPYPQSLQAHIRFFCGDSSDEDALKETEPKRVALYKFSAAVIRAFAEIANELEDVGYSAAERAALRGEVKYYANLRQDILVASRDYIDLKQYEPAMRRLIDTYIQAGATVELSTLDDMTLIEAIVERGEEGLGVLPATIRTNAGAMAVTIENNVRRLIIDERATSPQYYEEMSDILDALIQARKAQTLEYADYLKQLIELTKRVADPTRDKSYPATLNSRAKRALYDMLDKDESLALQVDAAVRQSKQDGWRNNLVKQRQVRRAIQTLVADIDKVNELFELVKVQDEY